MSAPNISLMNATYSAVSGVTLPKSGGGTATFPWVEGSETKTQNGTYDVSSLAEIVINVAGGGGGLTYETGTYTPSSNIARPTITWANTHTEAPIFVAMSDANGDYPSSNSNLVFQYYDPYKVFGIGFPRSASALGYAIAEYYYMSSSGTGGGRTVCQYNSDNTSSSSTYYPRYWASPTDFHPYSASTSRYWRSGRTYKWIAVWKPTS